MTSLISYNRSHLRARITRHLTNLGLRPGLDFYLTDTDEVHVINTFAFANALEGVVEDPLDRPIVVGPDQEPLPGV